MKNDVGTLPMAKRPPNISTGGCAERKTVGCLVGLILVLLCGCGHSPGAGPGDDSGTVDAEPSEYYCPAVFNSVSCTADWSDCQSVDARMLSNRDYPHRHINPIGLVVRDASTFESRWQGCAWHYPDDPPPDLPNVDFSSEMVVWHVEWHSKANALEPEVWDCGGCLVFVPQYYESGVDFEAWVFTAVAIPSLDASVQFEQSVGIY